MPLQAFAFFPEDAPENGTADKKNRRAKAPVMSRFTASDSDGRFDARMRVVALNLKIIKAVIEDRFRFAFDNQLRQRARFTSELTMRLFHMIAVKMGVPTCPDEITHFQVALLRHHVD